MQIDDIIYFLYRLSQVDTYLFTIKNNSKQFEKKIINRKKFNYIII